MMSGESYEGDLNQDLNNVNLTSKFELKIMQQSSLVNYEAVICVTRLQP